MSDIAPDSGFSKDSKRAAIKFYIIVAILIAIPIIMLISFSSGTKNEKDDSMLPENGQVFLGSSLAREGGLTIKSSTTNNCYIKLKDSNGNDVFSFFVRAGSNVTMNVPKGNYYVYFAYGDKWYGTEDVFGPDTVYSKDSNLVDFRNFVWEYTLYSIQNGNFDETPVSADEFN